MNTLFLFIPKFWHLAVIFVIIAVLIQLAKDKRPKSYTDDYGSVWDVLSPLNKGQSISDMRTTLRDAFMHCAIIGASGYGKTTGFLMRSAFAFANQPCSMIVLDPAKEIHANTAGYNHKKGKRILVLDFSNPNVSEGYNPLARAETTTELSSLADLLMAPQQRGSKDIFWTSSASRLLVVIFRLQKKLPAEYQNIVNSRNLILMLMGSPKKLDKIYIKFADNALFEEYKSIIRQDTKLLSNIVATTLASLKPWESEAIAQVTSHDTLDLDELRKTDTVLYIWPNLFESGYNVLYEILFSQLFQKYLSYIPINELDLHLLADEMGAFKIQGFPEFLALARKHRISCQFCVQSRQQIFEKYGPNDAHTILANSYSKVIFPNMEPALAQELQTRFGRFEFEREDTGNKSTRELATVSELIHMPEDTAIYLAGSKRPMKIKVKPFFKSYSLQRKSRIHPPELTRKIPQDVAMIDPEQLTSNPDSSDDAQ